MLEKIENDFIISKWLQSESLVETPEWLKLKKSNFQAKKNLQKFQNVDFYDFFRNLGEERSMMFFRCS